MSKKVPYEYIILYQCYICGLHFVDVEGTMIESNSRAYRDTLVTIVCKDCRNAPDENY